MTKKTVVDSFGNPGRVPDLSRGEPPASRARLRLDVSDSFDRRTFLRGAGTVALGLPFLEEMAPNRAHAAGAPPVRCVTLFFGLGVGYRFSRLGFDGPLSPLRPLQNKLAIFRRPGMQQASSSSAHAEGSTVIFVGAKARGGSTSGGASIDQAFKTALHPTGVPTPLSTLASGFWFRDSCDCVILRCWTADGAAATRPIKHPVELFDKVFGRFMPPPQTMTDPNAARELRLKKSVLDATMAQYARLTGSASPLGAASRAKLQDHFERVRALEKRVLGVTLPTESGGICKLPAKPAVPTLPTGLAWTTRGAAEEKAPQMPYTLLSNVLKLQADIWAMALRCDLVRFGSLMCDSAGGHIRFTGTYSFNGKSYPYNPAKSQHASWHENDFPGQEATIHLYQSSIAYALAQFDDRNYLEANGKTVLDNMVAVIGTEVGQNHDLTDVFHAVAGGGGKFRPGFYDQPVNCADVYNSVLRAYGISTVMAREHYSGNAVPGLLA